MSDESAGIEHRPHIGTQYCGRSDGKRILVVGHSHHTEDGDWKDYAGFTQDTVAEASEGKMQRYPFFARQPKYLDMDLKEYWSTIALINFAPDAVDTRYQRMTPEQEVRGRNRFLRLLNELRPTHVFVTTPKVEFGEQLPLTDEEKQGKPLHTIVADGEEFRWGTYTFDDGKALCCRLPHPQAARTALMQEAFATMLAKTA